MRRTLAKKIAISLPAALYKEAEKARRSQGQTRSEFFRKAVERLLREEREREAVARYVQGYLENPETPEETNWIHKASMKALRESPWEE
jgi:metal-responsive CopG/Arc/MetJ family transcriptional regulator